MKVKEQILAEVGYVSEKSLLSDIYRLNAMAKVEQYRAECEYFEHKYGMNINKFEKQLHKDKGSEDFQKEDDLQDWEFASNALRWWKEKLKDLEVAKNA